MARPSTRTARTEIAGVITPIAIQKRSADHRQQGHPRDFCRWPQPLRQKPLRNNGQKGQRSHSLAVILCTHHEGSDT